MITDTKAREVYTDGAVTVAEAVRLSGIGRTVLYDLMGRGEIAYAKIGSRRLIARRAIVDLLAAHAVGSLASSPGS